MYKELEIETQVVELAKKVEPLLSEQFEKIDNLCEFNSLKVLNAFHKNKVSDIHFNTTTGYGYNDIGRDIIEKVYADIFKCQDALVRNQFISGSHALTVTLFGLLRPKDILLSITGKPYDTLDEVIGIRENSSSLKTFDITYEQIELINNDFDYDKIRERLNKSFVKVIEIQRSKGYSSRKSISINQLEKVIKLIKEISPKTIVMIDNCYCELVNKKEPTEVGADIVVGSLIKNLGGGLAPNGAYVVGKKDLIQLVAERLTLPGSGKEVGPTLGINKSILQGLFIAPNVVKGSLKTAIFASKMLEEMGYEVEPKYNDERIDIVQNIYFNNQNNLIRFCQGIQKGSPIDSKALPIPDRMPGYENEIIMAAGTFTQGSSIELSCDGPLKEPYIGYLQGGLTYEYGKLGVMTAISNLIRKN